MQDRTKTKLLGTSRVPFARIRDEDLGTPWARIDLHIVPKFEGQQQKSDVDVFNDTKERPFNVSGRLSHAPSMIGQIRFDFSENDGDSFLLLPPNTAQLSVASTYGVFCVRSNKRKRLSLIDFTCRASNPREAQIMFLNAVNPALDHFSFFYNVPLSVSMIRVKDLTHQSIHVEGTAPYRTQILALDVANRLFIDMKPVYALYREAKNSESHFYKFLCCYKIMEGLIGGMRTGVFARAKKAGIKLKAKRAVVPNDEHITAELKQYVGKSINVLLDNFLTKTFRHAIAHFMTEKGILYISSPEALQRYASAAFVSDLCARQLIFDHEQLLAQLEVQQA